MAVKNLKSKQIMQRTTKSNDPLLNQLTFKVQETKMYFDKLMDLAKNHKLGSLSEAQLADIRNLWGELQRIVYQLIDFIIMAESGSGNAQFLVRYMDDLNARYRMLQGQLDDLLAY